MGLAVGVVVLAVVLSAVFILPKAVSEFIIIQTKQLVSMKK